MPSMIACQPLRTFTAATLRPLLRTRNLSVILLLLTLTTTFDPGSVRAQPQTENLVIVTLDGFRWQEVFLGMDSTIACQKRFNHGDSAGIFARYWASAPSDRRAKLLPFIWSTVAQQGRIYGNRMLGSNVDVANRYWFSYPGYNEIFTGYADTNVNTNSYPNNPNSNFLEFIERQPGFRGKVGAFGAWEAFSRILNAPRCGFPVVAAFEDCGGNKPTAEERLINTMRNDSYKPWGEDECQDVFTHYAAMEFFKEKKPRVLFIGYGETDEWAHAGDYMAYLNAAHQADQWIRSIWTLLQSDVEYRNKTTLFIAVDHGRGGRNKDQWTGHGQSVPDSHETWFAVLGPDTPRGGEMRSTGQIYEKQYARTLSSYLGLTFTADHPVGDAIPGLMRP
ncbi:MAG: phosphoglyceromutase [Bacteroidota bacterium]